MTYFLLWIALSIAVGIFAAQRGRGSGNWFLISALLSPVVGFIFLIALPNLQPTPEQIANNNRIKCPSCAELVMPEASVCKHCGATLTPDPSYTQRIINERSKLAEKLEAKNTIKVFIAIAAMLFFVYIWVERHGGGW